MYVAFAPDTQNDILPISRYFLSGTSWDRWGFSVFTSFQRLSHPQASPMPPEHIVAPCNSVLTPPHAPLPLCWRRPQVTGFWASSPCHSSCCRVISLSCLFQTGASCPGRVIASTEALCSWSDIEADHTCCFPLNFLWFCCTLFEMRRPEPYRLFIIWVSHEFTH